jgi:uncharacterized protein
MEFVKDDVKGFYKIEACFNNGIKINGIIHTESLFVMPTVLVTSWEPKEVLDLSADHFKTLLSYRPQAIILGTGNTLKFLNPLLYQCATQQGIGVEVMSTQAACRTYTVLMSEGRQILAALLIN